MQGARRADHDLLRRHPPCQRLPRGERKRGPWLDRQALKSGQRVVPARFRPELHFDNDRSRTAPAHGGEVGPRTAVFRGPGMHVPDSRHVRTSAPLVPKRSDSPWHPRRVPQGTSRSCSVAAFPVSPLNAAAGFATRVVRFPGMSNVLQGHKGSTRPPRRYPELSRRPTGSHSAGPTRRLPLGGGERRTGLPVGLLDLALRARP